MNTILILDFLKKLSANNDREWMASHKEQYNEARAEFTNFIRKTTDKIAEFDPSVGGIDVKDFIFKIHRDIRFSNDKRPFKEHFAAYIARGGKKSIKGGYYVHLQPGNQSLIGGGIYCPPSDALKLVRNEISYNGDKLVNILNDKKFKETFGQLSGESLKKAPKGFSPDDRYIDLIKFKSFDVEHHYEDKTVENAEKFIDILIVDFKIMKPFNDFVAEALHDYVFTPIKK